MSQNIWVYNVIVLYMKFTKTKIFHKLESFLKYNAILECQYVIAADEKKREWNIDVLEKPRQLVEPKKLQRKEKASEENVRSFGEA